MSLQRIRITYAKTGALRYTGTLDMQKVWERSLRRAHLPVAYTQGFHPQARLNQANPLPLGMAGRAEILDFWLDPEMPLEAVHATLSCTIPPGINILSSEQVDLRLPALQRTIQAAEYMAALPIDLAIDIDYHIQELLATESLPRQWRNKAYNLRPLVEALEFKQVDDGSPGLFMRLSAREGATGRPEEVLSALGLDPMLIRVERLRLIFAPLENGQAG